MAEEERLGKYEIRHPLGRGAMGVVYEGWDPQIERKVAIKTIKRPAAGDAETAEEFARFKREAQAAGRLQHPNIVGVFDYGETDELAYIVMELIEGESLKAKLDRGERFVLDDALRIFDQMLAGLSYSHERGVVHRDIKPANVMLTKDGHAKIADFGIARIESSSMTQAGTVLGTPAYMSPEQFRGETVDARTDIYSAGVVLYQLLTGERPFGGSFSAIMHKALNVVPPKPSDLAVTAPRPLDGVVAKAMAKRPEDRFPSAAAFAEAIKAALAAPEEAPIAADQTIVTTVARTAQEPPQKAATSAPPPQRAGKTRLPALIGAVVVALVIIVGGGTWLLTRRAPERSQPAKIASATRTPSPAPAASPSPAPASAATPAPAVSMPTGSAPANPASTTPAATASAPGTPAPAPAASPAPAPAAPTTTTSSPLPASQQAASAPTPPVATSTPQKEALALPPTPPAPAVVAPAPPPTLSATKIAATLASLPCTLVGGSLVGAGASARIVLAGIVGAGGPAAVLHRAIAEAAPTTTLDSANLRSFPDPASESYCRALDLVRPIATPFGAHARGFSLATTNGRTALVNRDPIVFRLTMPNFSAWLTLDYFSNDGSVAHLHQVAAEPGQPYAAGQAVVIGQSAGWTVGPPYGEDMILAIASAKPLFAKPRPESESGTAYLAALGPALKDARASGEALDATTLLLETSATASGAQRPAAAVAAGSP